MKKYLLLCVVYSTFFSATAQQVNGVYHSQIYDVRNYYKPDTRSLNNSPAADIRGSQPSSGANQTNTYQPTPDEIEKRLAAESKKQKAIEAESEKYRDTTSDEVRKANHDRIVDAWNLKEQQADDAAYRINEKADIAQWMAQHPGSTLVEKKDGYYVGELKDGKMNGTGRLAENKLRTVYIGGFKDDQCDGPGKLYSFYQKVVYSGSWKGGKFDGRYIVMSTADTTKQIEQFFRENKLVKGCLSGDCRNGEGQYHYENGEEFTGDFKNGIPISGSVRYHRDSTYVGGYNGARNGYGILSVKGEDAISGDWKNDILITGCKTGNCKDGTGVFTFPKGITWNGAFHHDKPSGEGEFQWGSEIQKGKIKNRKDGTCTFTHDNKETTCTLTIEDLNGTSLPCADKRSKETSMKMDDN